LSSVDLNTPLELQSREIIGKRLADLRADGFVPAVIHNHGQESLHVMGPQVQLEKIYAAAGKHHPLQLKAGSQEFLALIKDAHFNPVKRRLDHLVFQAIRQDEKVEAEVPIHIEGDIPAEKIGLEVLHQLDHIEIEALPRDLIDAVKVDGTKLAELGDKVMVSDLTVPATVTILTDLEHPIVTVVEPRVTVEEEPEPTEEGEATEEEGEGEGGAEPTGEGDQPKAEGDKQAEPEAKE